MLLCRKKVVMGLITSTRIFLLLLLLPLISACDSSCSVTQNFEKTNSTFVAVAFTVSNLKIECYFCPTEYPGFCEQDRSKILTYTVNSVQANKDLYIPKRSEKPLQTNTVYDFECNMEPDMGGRDICPLIPFSVTTKPAAPVINIDSSSNSNVSISWRCNDEARSRSLAKIRSYDVCFEPAFTPCFSSSQKAANFQLPSDGRMYQVTVFAVNDAGRGDGGTVLVAASMTAPTNVVFGETTSSTIEVKWAMGIEVLNIKYTICLFNHIDVFCDAMVAPSVLSKVFMNLKSNTRYVANVTAVGERNEATTNSVDFVYTNPNNFEIACSSPTNSSVIISWTDISENVKELSYSLLYLHMNISSISNPYLVTHLLPNTEYDFTILTNSAGNKKAISTGKCFTSTAAPANVTFGETTSSSVEVKWAMEMYMPNVKYTICLFNHVDTFCETMNAPSTLLKIFTNLRSNTRYAANVTAVGQRDEATTYSFNFVYTNPKSFEIVCSNQNSTSVVISWTDTTDNLQELSYSLLYLQTNITSISSPYPLMNLQPTREYDFTVVTTSVGDKKAISTGKCFTSMAAPSSVNFGDTTSSSIEVRWVMDFNIPNVKYTICLFNSANTFCEMMIAPSTLSKLFTNLKSNTRYVANVTAAGERDAATTNSMYFAYTNPNSFEVDCNNQTNSSVVISWSDASENVKELSYSLLYLQTNITSISSPYSVIHLQANTEYEFSVVTNSIGNKKANSKGKCKTLPAQNNDPKNDPKDWELIFILIPVASLGFVLCILFILVGTISVVIIQIAVSKRKNTIGTEYEKLNKELERYGSNLSALSLDSSINTPLQKSPDKIYYLNHYEHVKEIGRGGEGTVYQCIDIETGKIVAVKEYIMQDEAKEAVHLENVRKLFTNGSIQNNFLAPYLEDGIDDGKSYVVMPFYERDLEKEWKERRKTKLYMTEEEIVHLFEQIIDGVQFIHSKNLLHRDLKLQNVMLDKVGTAKIVDYNSMKNAETKTISMATQFYAAPEIFQGSATEKSDIYAIGVMLFEMISLARASDLCYGKIYFPLETREKEDYVHSLMHESMNNNDNPISDLLKRLVFSIIQYDADARPSLDVMRRVFSIIENKEVSDRRELIESFKLKEVVPARVVMTTHIINMRSNNSSNN